MGGFAPHWLTYFLPPGTIGQELPSADIAYTSRKPTFQLGSHDVDKLCASLLLPISEASIYD